MLDTKKSVAATTENKNINNINLNTLFNFTKSLDSDVEKFLVIRAFYQLNYFDLESNDREALDKLNEDNNLRETLSVLIN